MKLLHNITSLVIIILLFSCGKNETASLEMTNETAPFEMADEAPLNEESKAKRTEQAEEFIVERKLIKDGKVKFETDDINLTRRLIFESIEKYNGYTSSDNEYNSIGRISNTIIIRVPAKNFDLLLSDATKGIAKFDSKNIEVKDITEEFLDIEARLKTKKELENRYLDILKKANSVTDMLEVEEQLGQLRSEIESIEGRLKYLENNVSFSTLTISIYQNISNETGLANDFKNGFTNGWNILTWSLIFLINIWPFILIGIGFVVGIKMWRKRK